MLSKNKMLCLGLKMPSMLSRWSLMVARAGCWAGPLATCSPSLSSTTQVNCYKPLSVPNMIIWPENWFLIHSGISVTKEMSATTRTILDQIRVILIWLVFLIPWGPFLCRVQDYFIWEAVSKMMKTQKPLNWIWISLKKFDTHTNW